jgi:hypothetical protein
MPAVILWGATGQAKVVRPILECAGFNVTRVFDNARVPSPFPDVPMGGGRTDPDVQISRFRFFMGEPCSRRCR